VDDLLRLLGVSCALSSLGYLPVVFVALPLNHDSSTGLIRFIEVVGLLFIPTLTLALYLGLVFLFYVLIGWVCIIRDLSIRERLLVAFPKSGQETLEIDSRALWCLIFFILNLMWCVIGYCFTYDPIGTARPAWIEALG
jgi:hypothetical protein